MARIREELVLEDRFSGPLGKYIQKLSDAMTAERRNRDEVSRMTDATQRLVNELSGVERGLHNTFTDAETDRALIRLQKEMERTGLVWTSESDRMEAADMLMRVGLQQLAEEGRITASAMAEDAAAADRAAEAQANHEKKVNRLIGALRSLRDGAKKTVSSLLGFDKAKNPLDAVSNKVMRMGLYFFSVRKLIGYFTHAIERASNSLVTSWTNAKNSLNNLFSGTVVAALQGLQPAIDRLNAALNSEAGQKMARGLETAARFAGQAIGFLLDKVSQLIEFIGNNFQTVMTIAVIVVGLYAAKMLVAAAATLAAAWPLLLIVGLITAVIVGLQAAGVTSEQIFSAIGAGVGWLYTFVYNLVADIWNVIAVFAEFFANVFDDPLGSVARLFFNVFDAILGIVETVAGAIDALFGSNLAGAVSGFRSKMQNWVDDKFGEAQIKIDRMEKLDYNSVMADFAEKGAGIAGAFSDFSLSNALAVPLSPLNDIASSVKSIEKTVSLSDEDLKSLVDVAERRYVNQVNLTAQTPVITINGANTGRTASDRQNLANTIRDILVEQTASGSTRSTARAVTG